ncbi:cyclase-like protein 4 [Lolium perenne]|uniref:cyclase-like protein 4 n=1 Tax=Lolium perenne TaxID=4522 RepID=UPI0021F65B80|nr:cyclase-like protein 4 [Lolium perenne]
MELLPFFLLLLIGATAVAHGEPAYPGYGDDDAEPTCGVKEESSAVPAPERREEFDGGRILDISHYYREDMPAFESAEGTPGFLRLARSMRNGSDIANFSELRLTAHSGTHVDAPGHVFEHYYDAGFDVDTLDLAVLNGPAMLVDVPRDSNITADVLESLHIPKGVRRVLFRTLNTDRKLMWKKEFDSSYVGFMEDGAQWLIDNTDIRLVGIDYLSVGAYEECIPAHLVFLGKREVIIVEALNLEHVGAGVYTLHCLPLRLRGAEGSPARCILIK